MVQTEQIAAAARAIGFTGITSEVVQSAIAEEQYFTAAEGVMGAHIRKTMMERSTKTEDVLGVSDDEAKEINLNMPGLMKHITLCVIILMNGTKIVGVNHGPILEAQFDPAMGRKLAREDALRQIYPILSYAIRDQLIAVAEGEME